MQRTPLKKRAFLILLVLVLLLGCFCALGEEASITPEGSGLRYYTLQGEQCLTQDLLPEAALGLLGVDASTAQSAMQRDGIKLIAFSPEGRQVSLKVVAKPADIAAQSVFDMDAMAKEQFLTLVARGGHYLSAAWQPTVPGFALFSTFGGQDAPAQPLYTLSLATLYLGKLYAFQTDVVGREPTQEDAALLIDAASRALLLGPEPPSSTQAESAAVPALSLPQQASLTEESAAFTVDRADLPLALDPVPSILGTTTLVLKGTTQPKVSMRYTVNGLPSSRFKAGEDGSFSVTIPSLEADSLNLIELTAFKGDASSTVHFSVQVNWQSSPVVLSHSSCSVQEDQLILTGLALPGSTVQLIRKTATTKVSVAKDGSFSCKISLKKMGENAVTIRCTAPGYRRTDVDLVFTRVGDEAAQLAAYKKSVKTITYAKLLKKPASYEDTTIQCQGRITALSYADGRPAFILTVSEAERYICFAHDLRTVDIGQEVTLIGALTGTMETLSSRWGSGEYPGLTVLTYVP